MRSINDEVQIKASMDKAYEALTTQAGYRGWWNAAADVAGEVGGEAKLHFVKDGTPINMGFKIEAMRRNNHVRWTCVANDDPSWIDTTLTWHITEASSSSILVTLDHSGWRGEAPDTVAQGWKHFIGSLKAYVETGTGQPW